MSIAPVSSFPPDPASAVNSQDESVVRHQTQASQPKGNATVPISTINPNQEVSAPSAAASAYELPQDVVEVHQDPEIKDQLIIQYLNQAKDLVLQVPSTQELDVERGIAQDFQNAAKLRASESAAVSASEGAKGHGD